MTPLEELLKIRQRNPGLLETGFETNLFAILDGRNSRGPFFARAYTGTQRGSNFFLLTKEISVK